MEFVSQNCEKYLKLAEKVGVKQTKEKFKILKENLNSFRKFKLMPTICKIFLNNFNLNINFYFKWTSLILKFRFPSGIENLLIDPVLEVGLIKNN